MKPPIIALALSCVMALALPPPASAQLYIWTDKDGVKHVTNTAPPPEAQNVEAAPEAVYEPPDPETTLQKKIDRSRQRIQDRQQEAEKRRQKRRTETRRRVEDRNYQLSSVSVYRDGSEHIRVTGKVTGGGSCKRLKVSVSVNSDGGRFRYVEGVVENVGGSASRIFEARDWVGTSAVKHDWTVTDHSFRCLEQ